MRLVLALSSLGIGGTESYTLTVAEHLDRLGHEVAIYTPQPGAGAELARERGIALIDEAALSDGFDGALVQDAAVSYELADRCPTVPQIFVAHSESFDPQAPPQLAGLVEMAVVLNDRVGDRLRGLAVSPEIVRLHQPIDTDRFRARGALPEVPRRALILSNNHLADRQRMLVSACAGAGLELVRRGGAGAQSADPLATIAAADIVIGYGRSILEAMACGRAAYVYDWSGGSGWLTMESYGSIEADGFAGRDGETIDTTRLAGDLRRYSPSMGPVNRDLVTGHHRANVHVQRLVELFERVAAPATRPKAPLQEMARLVRLEWRARADVHGLLGENAILRGQVAHAEAQQAESAVAAELAAAERVREVGDTVTAYERTLSWRLTRPLRALGRLLGGLKRH
jgi:hypothetical protein